MKDHKLKLNDLNPSDLRRVELAYSMGQGLDEGEAWERVPNRLSNATAARDKISAEKRRWLEMRFAEERFDQDVLDRVREDIDHEPWKVELEDVLQKLSGGVLKSVWVFNAGGVKEPADQTEWDWQIGNLARNSAWLVQKQLLKSRSGIAVGWGKTIAESIDAVAARFKRGVGEARAHERKKILVIPTVGTPSGGPATDVEHSSSKQAANLNEAINGTWKDCISLENSSCVMPPDLSDEQREGYLRATRMVGGGFEKIYGLPNHSQDQKPLIETVDTALTSAGAFHVESFFLKQLVQTGGVPLSTLKDVAAGDMGSALIPDERINGNSKLEEGFNQILRLLLPGIRLSHYQGIARRVAGRSDGPAGVILVALNGNKANIVLNCVRHQAVSVLVIDYHLAHSLKLLLAEEKKKTAAGKAGATS